jgi:hypothetical protein
LTEEWYLQLIMDALAIKRRHPAKLTRAELGRLLKRNFKERYRHVSAEWLRQCLLLPRPEFRGARLDIAKYILGPTEPDGLGRCVGFDAGYDETIVGRPSSRVARDDPSA